ncbi:MAG: undecaprenyl-phosphate glucose phosphotransferase [Peptostreptococcaceae bacterium]|nr:undecaprenyl-phosphate glucose phosphotransferase [Peptostreptococcaceae bacterium]
MIRENQKYLNRIQIFLDAGTVVLSFLLAFYLRFYTGIFSKGTISLELEKALVPIFASIPVYLSAYSLTDLYQPRRTKRLGDEIRGVVRGNSLGFLILTLLLFAFKLINFSRYVLLTFYILNILLTSGSRLIIRLILRKYRRDGYNLKHCLLVGATPAGLDFLEKVRKNPHWGYHLVGILDEEEQVQQHCPDLRRLGGMDEIAAVLEEYYIDIVIITIYGGDYERLGMLIAACEKAGVKTNLIPYYYKYIPAQPYMDDLDGLPIIDTRHVPLDNLLKAACKRAFDVLFSLSALLLLSPLLLLAAALTKLTSPGPVIYRQERVGKNRRTFQMYKFRSMRVQAAEEEKKEWTRKDDPRKTRWGSFMRKTSIDELPQFFNVLLGDMSIVGPRPERPFFVEQFKEEIPKYMIKHQVRPGITGWAQVNGWRGDTSILRRIEFDLYYIENWTFFFDLKIIFLTVFRGFVNKNAY